MDLLTVVVVVIAGVVALYVGAIIKFKISESNYKYNHYTKGSAVLKDSQNLSDKVVIVTGSNTGIGREAAAQLYASGCIVVMACRNLEKANKARKDIINDVKGRSDRKLIVIKLDLSDLKTIDDFVKQFKSNSVVNNKLDFLINNAGVMAFPEFGKTTDGIERQFGVNHVGHFYLTNKLLPILRKNKSRIINVSSSAHRYANKQIMNAFLDKPGCKGPIPDNVPYDAWLYYGISKLCNILFTRKLNSLYGKDGVMALSLHPGGILTELGRNMKVGMAMIIILVRHYPYFKTIEQGASTTLRCVTISDDEVFGVDNKSRDVSKMKVFFDDCRAQRESLYEEWRDWKNTEIDDKLWQHTVKLIKSLDYLTLNE